MLIAENLRWLMKHSKFSSQPKLQRASGVSQTHIGNILRCDKSPSAEILEKLAAAFGLDVWQLMAPTELLRAGLTRSATRVLLDFARADAEGRKVIAEVAEGQAHYRPAQPEP